MYPGCESEEHLWSIRNQSGFTPPPIAIPLLEMGFTLKHIVKAIFETNTSGEFTSHTVNMLATWMLEHPHLEICDDEEASNRCNLFRVLDHPQSFMRQQNLDSAETEGKRGIGLKRRVFSELRSSVGHVDRVLQDRLRERHHVRGEGHALLRNEEPNNEITILNSNEINQKEFIPSSHSTIGNTDSVCPYCAHFTPYLDSHMTIYHPGCGTLWGSGVCGYCTDGFYILCYKCRNKYFQKGNGDNSLHIQAPDIIYDENDMTEADVQSLKFNIPSYEDPDKIKNFLGIKDAGFKVSSINLEKFDPLGMNTVPSVVNDCGNVDKIEKR